MMLLAVVVSFGNWIVVNVIYWTYPVATVDFTRKTEDALLYAFVWFLPVITFISMFIPSAAYFKFML